MQRVADGLWRIDGLVADCLNVYLAGDVLIDAATRWHTWHLLRKLPGHTPGHVIYFRDSDRVAIAGDVLANISFISFRSGLRLPPIAFCTDARQNFKSVELLASLNPSLVCFGHGPPLHKVEQLHWFV